MLLTKAIAVSVISLAAGAILFGGIVNAAPPVDGECKPGWGFGDKNNCHSGPPGHSVFPNNE